MTTSLRFVFVVLYCCLLSATAYSQLNLLGVSFTSGAITDNVSGLDQNFIGITASVEVPLSKFTARGEYSYLLPADIDDALVELDELSAFRGYLGYVAGDGKKFQFPLFAGAAKYTSAGDLTLDDWALAVRAGVRFYVTQRTALFADLSYDYFLPNEKTYATSMNTMVTNELSPRVLFFNIGVKYNYLKKD